MATIRARGPYQWQAIIRRRGYPVTIRTFEFKADAEAWSRATESEMDRGVYLDRSLAEKTTVGELIDRYRREVSPTKRGGYAERSHLTAIAAHRISQYSAAAVDGGVVGGFRDDQLKDGCAPATVVRRLALLSHVFVIAGREWGIHLPFGNPVAHAKKPRVKNSRDRRLREGEEDELLRRAKGYGGNLREVIIIALETAMRRGEIATLRWEQVDLKKRLVRLPETKNDEPRTVPLSSRAIEAFQALPRRIDGWVFGMTADAITQAFSRICGVAAESKQAKGRKDLTPLEDLTFHDLRHEAISRLFERGLDHMQVAAISGHKTLQQLKRYTHLRAEDLAALLG